MYLIQVFVPSGEELHIPEIRPPIKGGKMSEERRKFLKIALGVGVAGAGALMGAKPGKAEDKTPETTSSNGVVVGHSSKKEILYKKTANWDIYYKSSY